MIADDEDTRSELEVVEATAHGRATLTDEERERMLRALLPQKSKLPRLMGLGLAIAASVLLAFWLRAPSDDREKAGAASLTLVLVQQTPGREARVTSSPVSLTETEALRLIATRSEPGFIALYEGNGPLVQIWQSKTQQPAGQLALGPDEGRAGVVPEQKGVTHFWVVIRATPMPETLQTISECEACVSEHFEVNK